MAYSQLDSPGIFAQGTRWVRADFHMHTRADKEFFFDGEDNSFIREYVDRVTAADVCLGVITNHNKFDLAEFKALRKAARKRNVFLLPGVELSVKDGKKGIHTLVVFSDEWFENAPQTNHIQSFLGLTFAGRDNFENENAQSNHDLNETIRELDKYGRDYFMIFAHVEEDNGLWGGFGGASISHLGESEPFRRRCMGFQKVRTRDKRKNVQHWLGDWYPAEVEGCDCKKLDEIGQGNKTYLKIGAFTFAAVKFALLDHANRVAREPPQRTTSYIKSVAFHGARLDNTSIHLSPELNTLIGIRGSGKSSIIESIRYLLGIDLPFKTDRDYKEGSVKHALGSGGKITLTAVDRHGQEYEVRRILGEQPDVYVDGSVQPGINIRETVLHKPIYFGQKDLSSSGQGFEHELVEKLVGDTLADVRREIEGRKQAVKETVRRLQKLSDVADKQKECNDRRADAEHRLKVYRQHGVEEKLQKQVDFEQDSRTMRTLMEFVQRYIGSLDELISAYEDEFESHAKHVSKRNAEFLKEVLAILARVSEGFAQIVKVSADAKTAVGELRGKIEEFDSKKSALKEEFAEIARKLSDELKSSGVTAIEPNEFLKLREVIDNASQQLLALGKETDQQSALKNQLASELSELNEAWHEEFRIIKKQLGVINEQETALAIDIEYKGDKTAFLTYLKDTFRGSKLREATFQALAMQFADGAAIYREFDKAKATVGKSAEVFQRYFDEQLADLLTWQVPNEFTIKFHGKQLKHHSLGQRASALILFVLSQRDNDVVIIDQPEDDLDNQTIYEDVIKLVRKLKPETQFIFATHNPNIPVLGDAEQIIACTYSEDAICTQVGSIDYPAQQDAVVRIMEGGEEAFRERKRIYQVWKQQGS